MKRILFLTAAFAAMIVSSCSKEEKTKDNRVAVFLPSSESIIRWKTDKECLSDALGAMNLDYSVQIATDGTGAQAQIEQISSAINSGIKTLIITPIDFNAIISSKVLEGKSDLNIICHDRMIFNSKDVDFYSACNNSAIGELQASFLVQTLAVSGKSSMTLEMLAGPASDNNSKLFFEGAWKILKPYIDNGSIKIPSGKSSYEAVAINNWEKAQAESAMKERLSKFYPDGAVPDLILAPNDIAAIGAVEAIEKHNPSISSYPAITGQDNTDEARTLIKEGKISMTIDKSIKEMAYSTANIANMYLNGIAPVSPISFDNGIKSIPMVTSSPVIITKSNL